MTPMTPVTPSSLSRPRAGADLVVTGEAVALEVAPATITSRLLSGLIDYGIYTLGLVLSLTTGLLVTQESSDAVTGTVASLTVLLWVGVIPLAVEFLSRGLSAGRLVVGTRVVRSDGGTVRLRHSLVRTLVGVTEIWGTLAFPALCACVVTSRGVRLGDLLAGTYVVHERRRAPARAPLLMPPELAQWAAGADLRALPGDLVLVVHSFLQRASTLQVSHRRRLGARLAAQVQDYVSPLPPASTHPERFLAAVLVERRDRDLVLELRNRRLEESVRQEMARLPFGISDQQPPQRGQQDG